jgi:hypothetical protein
MTHHTFSLARTLQWLLWRLYSVSARPSPLLVILLDTLDFDHSFVDDMDLADFHFLTSIL